MKFTYWYFVHVGHNSRTLPAVREQFGMVDFNRALVNPIWTAIAIEEIEDCWKIDANIKNIRFLYEWGSQIIYLLQ